MKDSQKPLQEDTPSNMPVSVPCRHTQQFDEIKLVRRQYVEEAFGMSRSTIYRLLASQDLPKPVYLPGGGIRFVLQELMDWAQQRIKERDEA